MRPGKEKEWETPNLNRRPMGESKTAFNQKNGEADAKRGGNVTGARPVKGRANGTLQQPNAVHHRKISQQTEAGNMFGKPGW